MINKMAYAEGERAALETFSKQSAMDFRRGANTVTRAQPPMPQVPGLKMAPANVAPSAGAAAPTMGGAAAPAAPQMKPPVMGGAAAPAPAAAAPAAPAAGGKPAGFMQNFMGGIRGQEGGTFGHALGSGVVQQLPQMALMYGMSKMTGGGDSGGNPG